MFDKFPVNISDIIIWKEKYNSIYYIKIKENEYIYRTMSKGEFVSILSLKSNFNIDEDEIILNLCLLYPSPIETNLDYRLAGEVRYVIECINKSSGFSNIDSIEIDIAKTREDIDTVDNQIIVWICKAFPGLTINEINKLDYHTILHYLALSESMLGVQLKIEKPNSNIDFNNQNPVDGEINGPPRHIKNKPKRR